MKSQTHILLNLIILLPLLYLIYGLSFFQLNFLHLFIAIYIFSNLPDIDNSKSKISKTFFVFYLILGFIGINNLLKYTLESILIGLVQITIAIILASYHFIIADNSKKHRKFPHSFTFGIISSIIFGIFTSIEMALIAFFCFFLHLLFDNYLIQALQNDLRFWRKIFFFF
ncbi:MAG: metal-dependent hydrolase [Candidatus Woesearchaeota archaeon]